MQLAVTIPKQRHRVTNWAEYDAGLRPRGSLTVWFTAEAIAAWRAEPRTTRGGQPPYSALAITTALTLRAVFRLALRQTEGLIGSILQLLGLDLAVPDHSTLSRRAETLEVPRPVHAPGPCTCWWTAPACGSAAPASGSSRSTAPSGAGPGESCTSRRRRHRTDPRLGADDQDADDGSQVGPLLDQIEGPVASFTGDGAYDRDDVYAPSPRAILRRPWSCRREQRRCRASRGDRADPARPASTVHRRAWSHGLAEALRVQSASLGGGRYQPLETRHRRWAALADGRATGDRGRHRIHA